MREQRDRIIVRMAFLLRGILFLFLGSCAHLEERVQTLERDLSDLRKTQALLSAQVRQVDRLNQTTYLLQDSLEKLGLEIESLRKEIEDLKTRMKILEAATFQPPSKAREEPKEAQVPKESPSRGDESDPRSLYQEGYRSMTLGRYEDALSSFRRLKERFPEHELADNAYYWMGEIYLKVNKPDEAFQAFTTILERYPGGNKVPDALYKLALLESERKNFTIARSYLERILKEYPWSPVVDKARERLNTLPP
jgi:tol-pal system protein YbgF